MPKPYLAWLAAFTLLALLALFLIPPIPQWPAYHQFADARRIFGIPNVWNVGSNVLLLIVGILGFFALNNKYERGEFTHWQQATPFVWAFSGIILTSIGSAWYHWAPDNASLVWDRLPMTMVFTSTLALAWMERVNFMVGLKLMIPFVFMGLGSVVYWNWTESLGIGDLRFYGFIQFYSLIVLLALLICFPNPRATLKAYIGMIVFYAIAKVCEYTDAPIYALGGIVSGHTLKHVAAAIGGYYLVVLVKRIQYGPPS